MRRVLHVISIKDFLLGSNGLKVFSNDLIGFVHLVAELFLDSYRLVL